MNAIHHKSSVNLQPEAHQRASGFNNKANVMNSIKAGILVLGLALLTGCADMDKISGVHYVHIDGLNLESPQDRYNREQREARMAEYQRIERQRHEEAERERHERDEEEREEHEHHYH